MYRNLYPKSSFPSCPYTVLVNCPVRFYSIFDEIGQNVDGKMYFYHRSHCSTTTTESNGSLFSSLAPAKGYAQKNCAERFSALKGSPGHQGGEPRAPKDCVLKRLVLHVFFIVVCHRETESTSTDCIKETHKS